MIFFYYPLLLLFKVDTTVATQSCGLIYNMLIKMTEDPQENLAIVPKKAPSLNLHLQSQAPSPSPKAKYDSESCLKKFHRIYRKF